MGYTSYYVPVAKWSTTGDDSEEYPASTNAGILLDDQTKSWVPVPGVRRYTRQGGYPLGTGPHTWWGFGVVLARSSRNHPTEECWVWGFRVQDITNDVTIASVDSSYYVESDLSHHSWVCYSFAWGLNFSIVEAAVDATWQLQYRLGYGVAQPTVAPIHFHSANFQFLHRPM